MYCFSSKALIWTLLDFFYTNDIIKHSFQIERLLFTREHLSFEAINYANYAHFRTFQPISTLNTLIWSSTCLVFYLNNVNISVFSQPVYVFCVTCTWWKTALSALAPFFFFLFSSIFGDIFLNVVIVSRVSAFFILRFAFDWLVSF